MTENRRKAARKIVLSFLIGTSLTASAGAQASNVGVSHKVILSVAQVAVLALNDTSPLALVVVPRAAASSVVSGSSEGSRTLQYTTVNSEGSTRAITVQWSAGDSPPAGTSLKIVAASVPDRCGLPSAEVTVSGTPQRLITEIPSCSTGAGARGAVLRYHLDVENDSQVDGGTTREVVVTFTISDD